MAGDASLDGRLDRILCQLANLGAQLVEGLLERPIHRGHDHRCARRGTEAVGAPGPVPGGEHPRVRPPAQLTRQRRTLALQRLARPLEQDRDRDALPELLACQLDRALGLGAGNDEDALREALLDPESENGEHRHREEPTGQR